MNPDFMSRVTPANDVPTDSREDLRVETLRVDTRRKAAAAYELTKPRLNFLVVITTAVGFIVAAGSAGVAEQPWTFLLAILGTALTAAGSGALNQWLERDVDAAMNRTRNRPLPSGELASPIALGLGVLLATLGVVVLATTVNLLTATLGLLTLLLYVAVYTPMKRRSPWSTLVGAVPGAIPPAMGVTAATGQFTPAGWALLAILMVWQMPHFFGLALLYKDDYARGGLKVLPTLANGETRTRWQVLLFCVLMFPAAVSPTILGVAGWFYLAAALLLTSWFFAAGLRVFRDPSSANAKKLFLASIIYLPLLLAALMLNLT